MDPAQSFAPYAVYVALTALAVGAFLGLSWWLGRRGRSRDEAHGPYESGMLPTGGGRVSITPQSYLVAMLFVVFDLEAAFLYAWAVAAPPSRCGTSEAREPAVVEPTSAA